MWLERCPREGIAGRRTADAENQQGLQTVPCLSLKETFADSSADLAAPQERRKYKEMNQQGVLALGCLGAVWVRGALTTIWGAEIPDLNVVSLCQCSSVVFHSQTRLSGSRGLDSTLLSMAMCYLLDTLEARMALPMELIRFTSMASTYEHDFCRQHHLAQYEGA